MLIGNAWGNMIPPSPSPTEAVWKASLGLSIARNDQLSPGGSAMEMPMDDSTDPPTAHSASSSCADSWSVGFADQVDGDEDCRWDRLDQASEGSPTLPKLEPLDDQISLNQVKLAPFLESPTQESITSDSQTKQKRPRGRPRKSSLTGVAIAPTKVTKGRSKTGCITCRKRKKKCDEAKPRCMNCEKNAVVCEGYKDRNIWKSGRELAEEERMRRESQPTITLQPLFNGVETAEDRILWTHYVKQLSNVLTVEGEARNAFKDIILQLAIKHQGLMHSILALSSRHIDLQSPYGTRILQDNPTTSAATLQQRADFHHGEAFKNLLQDLPKSNDRNNPEYQIGLAARYGQILCRLLQTRADGNPHGEHRVHLSAYQSLIQESPPENITFHTFISEFFEYHIFVDDLLWHPDSTDRRLWSDSWHPTIPIEAPRLLGVADGLFTHLSQIASIRDLIRRNMAAGIEPPVDHNTLSRAAEIDTAVREWNPLWPPKDSRDRVTPLYKQMMWVYLFRTINPPASYLQWWDTFSSLPASTMSMPSAPQRRASMAASSRHKTAGCMIASSSGSEYGSSTRVTSSPRKPTRTNSMHELETRALSIASSRSSPPVIRFSIPDDGRIKIAVDESLSILESFKPSDPVQTLLLMPCLILGTACFEPAQRVRLRAAIKLVRGYTGMRSCDCALELLEELWSLMDAGDWFSAWDWQGVARQLGLEFMCA